MGEEVQGRCRRDGFLDLLKSLEADVEEITVVVESGGNCTAPHRRQDAELEHGRRRREFCCCRHKGILCNVTSNFIVLIGDRKKIFIPIDAIAAVIKEDCC